MRPFTRWTAMAPVLVLILATGCDAPGSTGEDLADAASGAPVTVDSCGREVTVDAPPETILAIGSEAPALLVAAGAGDRVTHYAGSLEVPFDEETRTVVDGAEHVIEDSHAISTEMIVATGVDIVIGTDIGAGVDIDALAAQLDAAGVTMLTVTGYCAGIEGRSTDGASGFDLIYRDVETYGSVFGTEDVAAASVEDMRARVTAATQSVQEDSSPRSAVPLYVTADGPLGAYGGESLASEQMELLGLENVFSDVPKRYFEPSTEELVDSDPDLIFGIHLPTGSSALETEDQVIQELRSRPELEGIPSLDEEGTVVPVNYYYTSPGPLAIDGLEFLAGQITAP